MCSSLITRISRFLVAHDDRHRGALRSPHRNREIRLTYPRTYTARYARRTRLATLAACLRTPPSATNQIRHLPPPPPRSGRVPINPTGQADGKGMQSPPKPSASPSSGRAVGAGCRQPRIIYRLTPSKVSLGCSIPTPIEHPGHTFSGSRQQCSG